MAKSTKVLRKAAGMAPGGALAERGGRVRGSGVRIAYEALKRDILDLSMAPGSPLDEVQLSERFAMSRTPIREALVRLAADGLITTLPNRNTIVTMIDIGALPVYFDALTLMYRVTTRAAAQHHKAEDMPRIRLYQTEFTQAVVQQDALAMIASNREFHVAMAEAGRNPYYTGLFARLLDEGRRILRLYYSSLNDKLPQQYVEEHEQMIRAVEDRDVALCDTLATAHAGQIVAQIQSYMARDLQNPIPL